MNPSGVLSTAAQQLAQGARALHRKHGDPEVVVLDRQPVPPVLTRPLVPMPEVVHILEIHPQRRPAVSQSDLVAANGELGRRGEELAARHLENTGLRLLDRNWRCTEGELDIVATDGAATTVVFCEVKTRSGVGFGTPFEAVTQGKRRKLRRLGMLWLSENRVKVYPVMRFDVIGVLWPSGESPRIEHREQAF